jgi:hypothetical protein
MTKSRLSETLGGVFALETFLYQFVGEVKLLGEKSLNYRYLISVGQFPATCGDSKNN